MQLLLLIPLPNNRANLRNSCVWVDLWSVAWRSAGAIYYISYLRQEELSPVGTFADRSKGILCSLKTLVELGALFGNPPVGFQVHFCVFTHLSVRVRSMLDAWSASDLTRFLGTGRQIDWAEWQLTAGAPTRRSEVAHRAHRCTLDRHEMSTAGWVAALEAHPCGYGGTGCRRSPNIAAHNPIPSVATASAAEAGTEQTERRGAGGLP